MRAIIVIDEEAPSWFYYAQARLAYVFAWPAVLLLDTRAIRNKYSFTFPNMEGHIEETKSDMSSVHHFGRVGLADGMNYQENVARQHSMNVPEDIQVYVDASWDSTDPD